jgi:hypothetical protein
METRAEMKDFAGCPGVIASKLPPTVRNHCGRELARDDINEDQDNG